MFLPLNIKHFVTKFKHTREWGRLSRCSEESTYCTTEKPLFDSWQQKLLDLPKGPLSLLLCWYWGEPFPNYVSAKVDVEYWASV
jgi:hypothetical protein